MQDERTHLRVGKYTRGFLPHFRVEGRPYFVTFRLAGTLPQNVLMQYQAEREVLIGKLRRPDNEFSWDDRQRLDELYAERVESYLDAGHGDCWLKQDEIAKIVGDALRFFDGQRYELSAWVVMPNHVHAVVRPEDAHRLDAIVKSWKSYTGRRTNQILGRTGDGFWAREYYDRVIRADREKAATIAYVHNNPVKAGLCSSPEEWKWSSAYRA